MKKVWTTAFLIIAGLYLCMGCEDDKEKSYTLTGTMQNIMKTPLAGRVIQCTNDYEDLRLTPRTLSYTIEANGSFTFRGLKEGNYFLRIIPTVLDSFNGKPVYAKYEKYIGIGADETLNGIVLADNSTAVSVLGVVQKSGGPFANATVRFTIFPDTNWANPIATLKTGSDGKFEFAGIPRVYVSGSNQLHYILNCRIDSASAYQRVRFDSVYCDTTRNLGTIILTPTPSM